MQLISSLIRWFGSFSLLIHAVAGSVGSVVQSIYTVCIIAGADQLFPAQTTKHDSGMLGFFTKVRGSYIV